MHISGGSVSMYAMLAGKTIFCLIAWQCGVLVALIITDSHPDTYLSVEQLAEKYGYPFERHEITTEDGYMLTIFRIPHGRNGNGVNKKPLLIQHGLYLQAEQYMVGGMHNSSLAYMSADKGYDVWLGNARGTQHGRKHVSLDPNKNEFWDFSFHQIGFYDVPAMVDYILNTTKKEKLHYIGHSQGGTAFFIMCSERPEYQKKIHMASLMSPASFINHCTWRIIKSLAKNRKDILRFVEKYSIYEFPPGTLAPDSLIALCINSEFAGLCEVIFDEFNGGRSGELDLSMLALILRFFPTASIKQLIHYFQLMESGHFRQWDYDSEAENLKKYGQTEPPDYKLESIDIPIIIYNSYNDNLVVYQDVKRTCEILPKCIKIIMMKNPKWTHLDFIFSMNAGKALYKPLLRNMDRFDEK